MKIFAAVGPMLLASAVYAQAPKGESSENALKKLSVEQLMDIEVSLVSKRPEKLSEAPSAIQVITGEDIRRSGVSTLPEALRLAANLQVAQSNAHDWGITARGFNGLPLSNSTLADKLLVMIDGRSIYTSLFGGVFWDVQNVLLEDIDRIEVISGPGGSLWGANAVNGVINIVTKDATASNGLYASGAAGTALQGFGAVRYGGSVRENLSYRAYGQRFNHNNAELATGANTNDAWYMTQGGFRMDYRPSDANRMTVQGDAYGGTIGTGNRVRAGGQNVLGRWTHVRSEDSDLRVQLYVDRTTRDLGATNFRDELTTYDLDLQYRMSLGVRHSVLLGGDYRRMRDIVRNPPTLVFSPANRTLELFSGFLQDEITLVPRRLKLTLGAKAEHNDYSGLELQPSVRMAWLPTGRQTLWAAVSRAVRSPARFDADVAGPRLFGDPDFAAEKVVAYEVGYRVQPRDNVSLSLATFNNRYTDLRSLKVISSPPLVIGFANDQHAASWGAELSGNVQLTDWWRLRGGYTYFRKRVQPSAAGVVAGSDAIEGNDPRNRVLLQSIMDLPSNVQADVVTRYVDTLPLPSYRRYVTSDARLAWQGTLLEVAVVGQNLWRHRQAEFSAARIPRSVYGKITLRR